MEYVKKNIDWIKENKAYDIILLITLILSYGFYATHYSYHIDSLVSESYSGTALISAGRWTAPVIHWLTNWMNFAPFWHTVIMAIMLFFAATSWIILFREVSCDLFPRTAYLFFGVFFVSFPVLEAQLTYPVLNIALGYLIVPISLSIFDKGTLKKQWAFFLISLALLIPAVDMYESFAAVYLVGLFAVLILKYLYDDSFYGKLKDLFRYVLKAIFLLLIAIITDFLVSKMVCYICCGTTEFWYNNNTRVLWLKNKFGIFDNAIWLLRNLFTKYVIGAVSTPFLALFLVTIIVGFVVFLVVSVKRKTFIPLLLFGGLFLSSLSLSFVVGYSLAFTQEQTLPIFVSFVIMTIIAFLSKKKWHREVIAIVLIVVVLNQTKTINNYAVSNYERFCYETNLLEDVGADLVACDIASKPVVFCADDYQLPNPLILSRESEHPVVKHIRHVIYCLLDLIIPNRFFYAMSGWYNIELNNLEELGDKSQRLGDVCAQSMTAYDSYIAWACPTIDFKAPIEPNIYSAMRRLGYSLIVCSKEDLKEAQNHLIDNNPKKRYVITETDDLIIVQFMRIS